MQEYLDRADAAPPARTLIDVLRASAEAHPDASALEDARGALSYRELLVLVRQTAERLHAAGVRRGDRVLVRESLSAVRMKRLSDAELNAYLASGEWQGKAGGYGIQGLAGAFIPWISGSFTGIMGLPVAETAALLAAIGYPVWRQA